ncbi:methyl-accepting chemotaxis protein [Herbaspirillum sp. alder98]|uniref:methyl-accepting chemotaxis protein n=1 Tax=Herbaspirillum sp. alder98 TaxID=2913096 RepID=UPI001CD8670E|nr:methyl-accepting chemotaxis protein [Herbaspirillum sp. alder98]MCA1326352.1 methyl-accepting chemotaxis protein [Herbaspirillum sp. alder98]
MSAYFKNLAVGKRIAAVFALIIVLLVVVSATAFLKISRIQSTIDGIINDRYLKVRWAGDVRDGVNDQIKLIRGMVIDISRPQYSANRAKEMEAAVAKTKAAIDKIAARQTTVGGQQKIKDVDAAREKFEAGKAQLVALVQAGDAEAADDFVTRKVIASQNAYLDLATAFANSQDAQLREEGADAVAQGELAIQVTLLCSIVAVLMALVAGFFLTRSIVAPLAGAVRVAENVAAGDLSTRIEVDSRDETGQLMQALRKMNDNLVAIVGDVRSGTEAITTASNEIASGNLDLSARTEQQAGSLEETASAMEEMTSTVKQNADNARQANQMASTASDIAMQGGVVVGQVVETMEAIDSSSRKIVDIISVIDGIAFQTNILALNAAVEAARAGEQGRGFAVVASEVRSLAQRSAAAAKEIKQLIDDSVDKVGTGTRLVAQAGATMEQVVASVKGVTDIVAEISAASMEQSTGIEEINRAITQMDEVTQQNAALVEEAAAAAQSMQQQAAGLNQAISIFTLAKDTSGRAPIRTVATPRKPSPVKLTPSAPLLARGNDADWQTF